MMETAQDHVLHKLAYTGCERDGPQTVYGKALSGFWYESDLGCLPLRREGVRVQAIIHVVCERFQN